MNTYSMAYEPYYALLKETGANILACQKNVKKHAADHEKANVRKRKTGEEVVPIWHKSNLTLEEASQYFGLGINTLRRISNDDSCEFVLYVGNKRLLKRKALEAYLESSYSI